jgi:hypothetical protein
MASSALVCGPTWSDHVLKVDFNSLDPAQRVAFLFGVEEIASRSYGAHNTGVTQHRALTKEYGRYLVEWVDGRRIRRAEQASEMVGDERFEARVD